MNNIITSKCSNFLNPIYDTKFIFCKQSPDLRGGGGVPAYNLGWFWVREHNFTHVRPRSKNGAKHQYLSQTIKSFHFETNRFVSKKQAIEIKNFKIG